MPRKLPWATGNEVKARVVKPRAVRKSESSVGGSDDQTASKNKLHQTSSPVKLASPARPRRKKRQLSRTPSTSPPRAPPSKEYMLEGYDADDIYMMVEDEFQALAQSFTQHLHHAEYLRLKKKARETPSAQLPKPTEKTGFQTRKKLEAGILHDRQSTAVKRIATGTGLPNLRSDEEDEADDDPWTGTSLAGLMTAAQSQKRTALVGLEKIPSSTRAARGFSRGDGNVPANLVENQAIINIFKKINKKDEENKLNETVTPSEDDDLDPRRRAQNPLGSQAMRGQRLEDSRSKRNRKSPSLLISSQRTPGVPGLGSGPGSGDVVPRPAKRLPLAPGRRAISILDDSDGPEDLARRSTTFVPDDSAPSGRKNGKDRDKDKKSRGHEIPTFLV